MSLLSILLVGFLLGLKHATEVDHLAAVATLAAGRQSLAQTMRQGVAWGVGHAITLMLFGGMVLLLGKTIAPTLERTLELVVGLMLIALGADVLRRLARQKIHFHAHVHAHSHAGPAPAQVRHNALGHDHDHAQLGWLPLRALMVGMMHGMAGTAALILLSLEAVQSFSMGMGYIALFGFGSVTGMALLSAMISLPLRLSVGRLTWLHHGITVTFGGFSCLLGAAIVYQIGVVEGLLV